jgi:hypothetical protein
MDFGSQVAFSYCPSLYALTLMFPPKLSSHSAGRRARAAVSRRSQTIQLKWLACIILKNMQLGIGEKQVLAHLHEDAVDRYNVTCDLREVCAAVRNRQPGARLTRQDIKVTHLSVAHSDEQSCES